MEAVVESYYPRKYGTGIGTGYGNHPDRDCDETSSPISKKEDNEKKEKCGISSDKQQMSEVDLNLDIPPTLAAAKERNFESMIRNMEAKLA